MRNISVVASGGKAVVTFQKGEGAVDSFTWIVNEHGSKNVIKQGVIDGKSSAQNYSFTFDWTETK